MSTYLSLAKTDVDAPTVAVAERAADLMRGRVAETPAEAAAPA